MLLLLWYIHFVVSPKRELTFLEATRADARPSAASAPPPRCHHAWPKPDAVEFMSADADPHIHVYIHIQIYLWIYRYVDIHIQVEFMSADADPHARAEGLLRIVSVSASRLAPSDWLTGSSDPYCELSLVDDAGEPVGRRPRPCIYRCICI